MRPQQDRAPSPAPRAPKRPERADADSNRSETKRGEAKYDDAKRGDAKRRDTKFGDAKFGEAKRGDAKFGATRKPGSPATSARAYEPAPRPERSPGAEAAPKAQRPDKNGGPAKPMTVDSIIAAGDPGDKPAPQKRKRLPSERPADPVKPAGRPRNSGGKSAGGAPGKTSGKAKDKDKPHASRAERKATGVAGNSKMAWIFITIAALTLFMSLFNYVNYTIQTVANTQADGHRMAAGAGKAQIFRYYL